ncbi:MAG: bacteriohemerythrin [Neisseria sp.]|nr:bacteriohemerythrin [Neisseria sp.]
MSYFQWTAKLNTNIPQVDEQHKVLVQCINELYEANQRKDFAAEGKVIQDLITYTIEHFTDEEKLMEDAGYALSKQHKQIHQRFVDKVAELQKSHQAGNDIGQELLDMLHSWLFTHITHHDRGFIQVVQKYLAEKKAGEDELQAEAAVNAAFTHKAREEGFRHGAPIPKFQPPAPPRQPEQKKDVYADARENIPDLRIWR